MEKPKNLKKGVEHVAISTYFTHVVYYDYFYLRVSNIQRLEKSPFNGDGVEAKSAKLGKMCVLKNMGDKCWNGAPKLNARK